MRSTIFTQLALVASILPSLSEGHTWVELLRNIASNGSFTGADGYPRGYQSRSDPNFSDLYQTWQIENGHGANPTLCDPHAQNSDSQGSFARLQAAPGSPISLLYQENGHVTLPDVNPGKPANRGTVYIYATQQPEDGEKYYDVYQKWNTAGTGGDGRGKLISTQNFDDGQCFQINSGSISTERQALYKFTPSDPMGTNLWCQNNIVIPKDVDTSKLLTLYWIWKWDTAAGVDPNDMSGKNQTYTSCMDIELHNPTSGKSAVQFEYAKGQDVQQGGLSAIFDKLATGNVYAVDLFTDGASPSTTGSATGSSSTAPTPSSKGNPPPPLATSSTQTTATDSATGCAAAAVSTQTVFVFGPSTGTIAPTASGLSYSTAGGAASGTMTQTQVTVVTATSLTTAYDTQASTMVITFTASDGSAAIPTPSNPPVESQISDGQPQAPAPTTASTQAASAATSSASPVVSQISDGQPQAPAPTSAAATSEASQASSAATPTSASAISDNPIVEPVPTDSSGTFTFEPASTSTVTFQPSASTAATATASSASATATSGSLQASSTAAPTASSEASATTPSPAAASTAAASSTSSSASPAASQSATTPSKKCAPTKGKRVSKVFAAAPVPAPAPAPALTRRELLAHTRGHARQWRRRI